MTSSSITVQWGAVDCIHRNGDITGYSIQYEADNTTRDVLGGSVTEATVSNLMPSTNYSIQVAAVNSAGTGPYSVAIVSKTNGKQFMLREIFIIVWSVYQHDYELFQLSYILFCNSRKTTNRSIVHYLLLIHYYLCDHLMVTG